ncbi:cytidine deaminase [Caldicoprobacter faecalis]|uniref:Cytidine deaminase n=2 Tax=Caldicoprobacter faecalis TaxID=937334 RepID=A0A1I5XXF4_9FIRM|nr:MAG: cytidine deaminase [Caldicoprobacter oshimai]SFQ36628.1 cytidine deaminase [Caldicoprobacter faecalis]
MIDADVRRLIDEALKVKERAYVPYSNFRVGAALLAEDGSVYTGCNVENASYGATCCAERVAIFSAVADGKRSFKAVAVVSDYKGFTFPCGICRQVMLEFDIPTVIVADSNGTYREYTLKDLLPNGFKKFDMQEGE